MPYIVSNTTLTPESENTMTDDQVAIPELPASMRDTMRRTVNKGLAVAYINADLVHRASIDVRSSIVLYDEAGVFETLIPASAWGIITADAATVEALLTKTNVRFWSKGI